MKKKLKIALRRCSSSQIEQGFALPVAVGMGLIMVLVGTTMMVKSQGDQMTASAQKATGESLSVAEAGVARVQALMNNARPITTKNLKDWRAAAEPYRTTTLPKGCASTSASSVDVTPYVDADGNGAWVAVSNGQFRIRSYTYKADPNDPDGGTGTLEIEGQALRNGQTLAIAPLEVEIPVIPAKSMSVPGLWARNIVNIGNNLINGDVQLAGCKNAGGQVINASGTTSPISSSNYTGQLIVNPHQAFPSLPSLPGLACSPSVTSNCYYEIPALTGTTVAGSAQAKLPRVNSSGQIIDKPINGNYYYLINNNESQGASTQLSISSPTLTIDTSSGKVILFLKGNIDMKGSATIAHEGVPTNFQIYGSNGTKNYYCPSNSLCTTSTIQFAGTAALRNAFVYAPSATAGAKGCGANGCLSGSLWVNSWDGSSATSKAVVTQTANWVDLLDDLTPPPSPIKPVSTWQREAR